MLDKPSKISLPKKQCHACNNWKPFTERCWISTVPPPYGACKKVPRITQAINTCNFFDKFTEYDYK